jgi:uncharacterized membrane protein YgaE (UPF0421/DUF939 family)
VVSHLIKSKTLWFAVAIAVLSVLQGFIFQLPLSPMWQAIVGCVIAVVVAVLRFVTTQPLSEK